MATFRFECNGKPTKNGKYMVFLCVTIGGKRKRTKTNIELNSRNQFNAKCKWDNWIRSSVPESKKWNKELHDLLENAKSEYSNLCDNNQATCEKLVNALKSVEVSPSFLEFAKGRTEEILSAGGIGNYKQYNCFLNKLQEYLKLKGKSDILFSELTPEFLSSFDNYLHKRRNERDSDRLLHQNTIHKTFVKFRTLVHRAIEMGYMASDKNPFFLFKCAGVKTQKDKLNEEELASLLALELEEGSLLWHCRNYFFFSFYCAGIRVADLIQLRWINITSDGRLNYQMGKNHKVRDLYLVEQAKNILQYYHTDAIKATDYIFPLLDFKKPYAKAVTMADKDTLPIELKKKLSNDISAKTALINKYLKKLAKMAGIEKNVSMHISRHSFARLAKVEGTDNSILQSLLAHSSVSVTEGYMGNFDTSTTDKALQNIFKNTSKHEESNESDKIAKLQAMMAELSEEGLAALLASVSGRQSSTLATVKSI